MVDWIAALGVEPEMPVKVVGFFGQPKDLSFVGRVIVPSTVSESTSEEDEVEEEDEPEKEQGQGEPNVVVANDNDNDNDNSHDDMTEMTTEWTLGLGQQEMSVRTC